MDLHDTQVAILLDAYHSCKWYQFMKKRKIRRLFNELIGHKIN